MKKFSSQFPLNAAQYLVWRTFIISCSCIFFFSVQSSDLQAKDYDPYLKNRINTGIDAMYGMRYTEAAQAFDDIIKKYPTEPAGYFFRSQIHLWRYLFDYSEPDFKLFLASCDKAISVAETNLAQNPQNSFAQAVVGAVYGFRSMANFRAENFVKATLDGRSCYNYLSDVIKKNPQEYDAYLGLGMFHFGIGVLPKEARYGANFAGLKGDRESGLREIEQAAERSTWARNDAKMFLAMINIYYNRDFTRGLKYLTDLIQSYPNNIPVLYTLGNVDMLLRKPQTALPYYRRALQNADTNFRTFTAFAHYRIAEAHFRLNEFDAAKASFQRFFKGKYERSFRGMALLRLALCYEMEGNRAEALKGYAKCTALPPFEPDDKFAIRRAKEYIKEAPNAAQIQLLKGINCVESSRFQEAEQLLRPLVENTALSKEIRSEAAYNLGEALREERRGAEAIPFYLKAVECEAETERWTMPWSYYRIATIHYNAGKTELSRSYLDKAKVFSKYDFEEWLQFNMYRDASLLKY